MKKDIDYNQSSQYKKVADLNTHTNDSLTINNNSISQPTITEEADQIEEPHTIITKRTNIYNDNYDVNSLKKSNQYQSEIKDNMVIPLTHHKQFTMLSK